jgi:hypothetical protein
VGVVQGLVFPDGFVKLVVLVLVRIAIGIIVPVAPDGLAAAVFDVSAAVAEVEGAL